MNTALILIPLVAAFFGWLAGRMITRLLFFPVKPVRILGMRIQGLLPARQDELTAKLGKLIGKELQALSGKMEDKAADPANFQKIMPFVEEHIDQFLRVRLVEKMPMIGMLIGERTILEMKTVFTAELEILFPVVMKNYLNSLETSAGLEALVTEQLNAIKFPALANTVADASGYLGKIGLATGIVTGLVQVIILLAV